MKEEQHLFSRTRGYDFNTVVDHVAEVLGINKAEVLSSGR